MLVVLGYCYSSLLIVCENCALHMHSNQFVVFLELSVQEWPFVKVKQRFHKN